MPKIHLTHPGIEKLTADRWPTDFWDEGLPGFGVRVHLNGRKTFLVCYVADRRRRRLMLGTYPTLSLVDARDRAREILAAVARGEDPQAAGKAATFAELADLYVELHAKREKKRWREDARIIGVDLLPHWKDREAKDIDQRDVIEILNGIVQRGSPSMAKRTKVLISTIYNFGIGCGIVDHNPCRGVPMPGKERRRDRVLSEEEIRAVWQALDQEEPIMAATFKMRLLTAQRGNEVLSMRWEQVNGEWWTIPPQVAMSGIEHRVPISPQARALLEEVRQRTGHSVWVFASQRRRGAHITAVQKAAARIAKAADVDFVPHDLRRTAASLMTSMGISRLVVSKILNHLESRTTAANDLHNYDEEKRRALEMWGSRLEEIVNVTDTVSAAERGDPLALRNILARLNQHLRGKSGYPWEYASFLSGALERFVNDPIVKSAGEDYREMVVEEMKESWNGIEERLRSSDDTEGITEEQMNARIALRLTHEVREGNVRVRLPAKRFRLKEWDGKADRSTIGRVFCEAFCVTQHRASESPRVDESPATKTDNVRRNALPPFQVEAPVGQQARFDIDEMKSLTKVKKGDPEALRKVLTQLAHYLRGECDLSRQNAAFLAEAWEEFVTHRIWGRDKDDRREPMIPLPERPRGLGSAIWTGELTRPAIGRAFCRSFKLTQPKVPIVPIAEKQLYTEKIRMLLRYGETPRHAMEIVRSAIEDPKSISQVERYLRESDIPNAGDIEKHNHIKINLGLRVADFVDAGVALDDACSAVGRAAVRGTVGLPDASIFLKPSTVEAAYRLALDRMRGAAQLSKVASS